MKAILTENWLTQICADQLVSKERVVGVDLSSPLFPDSGVKVAFRQRA